MLNMVNMATIIVCLFVWRRERCQRRRRINIC